MFVCLGQCRNIFCNKKLRTFKLITDYNVCLGGKEVQQRVFCVARPTSQHKISAVLVGRVRQAENHFDVGSQWLLECVTLDNKLFLCTKNIKLLIYSNLLYLYIRRRSNYVYV